VLAANGPDSLIWWEWVGDHTDEIWTALRDHVELTVISVLLGILVAAPMSVLAYRWRRFYAPFLGIGAVLYTIPSLAAFVMLREIMDKRTAAILVLASYTLLILVRNIVTGLDGVPAEVKEAAQGMGYSRARQLLKIELPIAMPVVLAGVRIATVTVVGLVPVTAIIGVENLGTLITDGLRRDFSTPLVIGAGLSVLLAVVLDLLLLGVQRVSTPWARRKR
jgi:osmoprotectant transport system permease protein